MDERFDRNGGSGIGDGTSAAVALAILTGDDSGIEEGLLENIRYGGIAHVFAVSGLHIGALYAFCLLLVKKTPLRKTSKCVRFIFTVAVLLLYGGVCGFSASVVRAIVVCLVFYVAKLFLLHADSLETLGLAATAILPFAPASLFTLGFQLSFAACLGIVFFNRKIANTCYHALNKVRKAVLRRFGKDVGKEKDRPPTVAQRILRTGVSFFSVSLSAQIFTAPVSLAVFGYLSLWSLLLNCIFVPVLSAVFSLLLALAVLACVFPFAGGVLLYLPSVFFSAILLFFQTVDLSVVCITGISLSAGTFVGYYSALLFLTDKWNVDKRLKYALVMACFAVFAVCLLAANV